MSAVDVLAVLDRFCNSVLPGKLWDGSNPYCNRPGREGSDYSDDLAALNEARAAVAELIAAAKWASATLGHAYHTTLVGQLAEYAHTDYQRLDAALARVGGAA